MRFSAINIIAFIIIILNGYILMNTKYDSHAYNNELNNLEKQISTEKETIEVLQAEWSYLNKPERLSKLSEKYLRLAPVRVAQLDSIKSKREQVSKLAFAGKSN